MNITMAMDVISFLLSLLLIVMTIIAIIWLVSDWTNTSNTPKNTEEVDITQFTQNQERMLRDFVQWTQSNNVPYFLIRNSLITAFNPEHEFHPTTIEVAILERDFDKIPESPFEYERTSFGYRLTSLNDIEVTIHVFILNHHNGVFQYSTENHVKVWSAVSLKHNEIAPLVPCRIHGLDVTLACPHNAIHHFQ